MDNLSNKLSNLTEIQKEAFNSNLRNICEFRDSCILYGAKDPVNLPEEDFRTIEMNLYNQMFGENYKTFDN